MKWLMRAAILCAGVGVAAGVQADGKNVTAEYGKDIREVQAKYAQAQRDYNKQQSELQRRFSQQLGELQRKYHTDRRALNRKYREQQTELKKEGSNASLAYQLDQRKAAAEYNKAVNAIKQALDEARRAHNAELRKSENDYRQKQQSAQRELNKAHPSRSEDREGYQKAYEKYTSALQAYEAEKAKARQQSEQAFQQAQENYQSGKADLEGKFSTRLNNSEQKYWNLKSEIEQRQEQARLDHEQKMQTLEAEFSQQQVVLDGELKAKRSENDRRLAENLTALQEAMRKFEEQQDLISQGQARTAELGIYLAPQTDGKIVIDRVLRRSAAEEAGIKRDDVLLAVNKVKLPSKDKSGAALRLALDTLGQLEMGQVVELDLKRSGKKLTKSIAVKPVESTPYGQIHNLTTQIAGRRVLNGQPVTFQHLLGVNGHMSRARLEMTVLNEQLGSYFGAKSGVLITNVDKGNVYQLEPGDVIVSIGGRSTRTPNKVTQLLGTYDPGEQMEMVIVRNKKRRSFTVELPER